MNKLTRMALEHASSTAPEPLRGLAAAALKREKRSRATRRERSAPRRAREATKRQAKGLADSVVYDAVTARDGYTCTVSMPVSLVGECSGRLTIDHQWGRGKAPTLVENCRMLCEAHHRRKTDSKPDRVAWLEDFQNHCLSHNYGEQWAQASAVLDLERAQHPGARAGRGGPDAGTKEGT